MPGTPRPAWWTAPTPLLDQELDLVVIGSPPATHAALADRFLDAGVAVVVDKPFTVTSARGRALVEKADRLGVPLTVFQNRRWDGDFLTLQRLLTEGGGILYDLGTHVIDQAVRL